MTDHRILVRGIFACLKELVTTKKYFFLKHVENIAFT